MACSRMGEYYFLLAALPSLTLDQKDISFKEFKDLCVLNLSEKHLGDLSRLLRPIDLYNIKALWQNKPLDDRGNYGSKELEEKLVSGEDLPQYLVDFLDRYESKEERLRYFSSCYGSLFRDEQPKLKGFLQRYYEFERQMRLVLTALRAKASGKDIVQQLQFEDPSDLLVADILAQKDAPNYTPVPEFEEVATIFSNYRHDPWKLQHAILEYKLVQIEEMEQVQDFGIDRVLSYAARLLLVEEISRLDRIKGMEQLSKYE